MEWNRALSCISQTILPTPFPLGKPQQVIVLVQRVFLFALCKEVTITNDNKCLLESEVT